MGIGIAALSMAAYLWLADRDAVSPVPVLAIEPSASEEPSRQWVRPPDLPEKGNEAGTRIAVPVSTAAVGEEPASRRRTRATRSDAKFIRRILHGSVHGSFARFEDDRSLNGQGSPLSEATQGQLDVVQAEYAKLISSIDDIQAVQDAEMRWLVDRGEAAQAKVTHRQVSDAEWERHRNAFPDLALNRVDVVVTSIPVPAVYTSSGKRLTAQATLQDSAKDIVYGAVYTQLPGTHAKMLALTQGLEQICKRVVDVFRRAGHCSPREAEILIEQICQKVAEIYARWG